MYNNIKLLFFSKNLSDGCLSKKYYVPKFGRESKQRGETRGLNTELHLLNY